MFPWAALKLVGHFSKILENKEDVTAVSVFLWSGKAPRAFAKRLSKSLAKSLVAKSLANLYKITANLSRVAGLLNFIPTGVRN